MRTEREIDRNMQKVAEGKVTAKCGSCGHNWKLERGDAFLCPYCANAPTDVLMQGGLAILADEESERWR